MEETADFAFSYFSYFFTTPHVPQTEEMDPKYGAVKWHSRLSNGDTWDKWDF